MSPPRRRSARLASGVTPKPKPTSHLSSVFERDEAFTTEENESLNAIISSPSRPPATPASSSPVKLSMSEMHPSKVHPTAAGSEAQWLGFRDLKPSDNSRAKPASDNQATPSKLAALPSSPFTFRFVRPVAPDSGLSTEAQRMMYELREEAAKIKADLTAQREQEKVEDGEAGGRKIAHPKGKSGRFSAAHMAQFKKMDSIADHPAASRAQIGRSTPAASALKRSPSKPNLNDGTLHPMSSLKRSPSKANLDDTSILPKSNLKRSPSKASLDDTPIHINRSLKRSPSKANLDYAEPASTKKHIPIGSPSKLRDFANEEPPSPAKRARQHLEDDISTSRPISRDASFIPRPKSSGNEAAPLPRSQSSLAALMSPTKSSMAKAAVSKMPPPPSMTRSPSKPDLRSVASLTKSPSKPEFSRPTTMVKSATKPELGGGLTRSATTNDLRPLEKGVELRRRIVSPGRFERVKSILRGGKTASEKAKSAIPQPATGISQTPGPQPVEKKLPALPFTTPRRKLFKRVGFTPDTKRVSLTENSPSALKSGTLKKTASRHHGEVNYPILDSVLAQVMEPKDGKVFYPDLSAHRPLHKAPSQEAKPSQAASPTIPGTFTFRSDHTIRFNSVSPTGFGSSPGQASLRHVRASILPTIRMPGSFPFHSEVLHEDKENKAPMKVLPGKPHGMPNKKRHRASSEEGDFDQEAADRAGKRRKAEHVPEGDALLAPRLMGATPGASAKKLHGFRALSNTPSPAKKRHVLSLSRLNMLAKPKMRT